METKQKTFSCTLNVGLDVKKIYKPEQLTKTIDTINPTCYIVKTGIYEGKKEQTFVCLVNIPRGAVIKTVENLCIQLDQTCIAVEYMNNETKNSMLIYNPFAKNCAKLKFDVEYFIQFTD